ncbi:MAG TPA: YggT family protein [Pyrinomonadaceae bacterium]|nr:YggT family protein [Pyrinomonadaceae bacterium]
MPQLTLFFETLFYFVTMGVVGLIVAAIVLMLLRLALNYADLNPFSRPVLMVRNLTDPFINPVRRSLLGFGFSPNMAPLVTILIIILVGWLALRLVGDVIMTLNGIVVFARLGRPVALVGALLYGFLGVYSMLILIRIIFSWGMVGLSNPVMRFLVRATDPLLAPLRRIIPPLGFFDISPIVAFLLIWLFQAAILGTLLRF